MKLTMKMTTVALFCLSGAAMAADINLVGTVTQEVQLPATGTKTMQMQSLPKKTISLMAVNLSADAKSNLVQRTQYQSDEGAFGATLPGATQLGMNGLSVLDQGAHGSCVVFAVTAALDAVVFNGKDEISQLCELQLGNYLARHGYVPSGWDGSAGHLVLNQVDFFGVVTKATQSSQGCGGLTSYPLVSSDTPTGMTDPQSFHAMSKNISRNMMWYPILHEYEALSSPVNMQRILTQVKSALNAGDRVVLGTLLIDIDQGVVGALGTYHGKYDSWILTEKIRDDLAHNPYFAAHELVITGYDDSATVVDANGESHTGLLTLRNSWGRQVGDKGNFYMSYDYFKEMAIEAHRVRGEQSDKV